MLNGPATAVAAPNVGAVVLLPGVARCRMYSVVGSLPAIGADDHWSYVTAAAPVELTYTLGLNAACPVWTFMSAGSLHLAPPSVDVEITTSSFAKPLKRPSCQTT